MKKSCKTAIAFFLAISLSTTAAFGAEMSDLSDHWARDYIYTWVEEGLISGYDDGTFRPDNAITRAEFMYIVNRAYGFNESVTPADISFTDVSATDANGVSIWYYTPVRIAVAAGYISGYDDGTMRPNDPISRQEAAVVITKLNNLTPDASKAVGFKDSASIEAWSKPYIGAVAEATFMKGDDLGNFNPTKNLTRAEAVVLLSKSSEGYTPSPAPEESDEITIDLPVTTDVAINAENYIIRYSTTPSDVTVKAETNNDLLTVEAFSSKMTLNTGSKAGVTRITLTLSKEGYETTQFVIDVNVVDSAAQRAIRSDYNDLTEDSITLFYQDESLDEITGNLNLPTRGDEGSKITWTSSNTDIISITEGRATVTRPYYTDGRDVSVTLTATLENNGYTEEKTFHTTVLRAEPSNDTTVESEVYAITANGTSRTISSARQAVTESLTVGDFLDNLEYHPYAEVKVASEEKGKSVNTVAKFDDLNVKASSTKSSQGDYLLIKSEDGSSVRGYQIKTMDQNEEVEDFKWSGNGVLSWTKPDRTYGYYVTIYKNGKQVEELEVRAHEKTELNVLDTMRENGVGTYTAAITNKGDLSKYAHSAAVETSTQQRISSLSTPTDLSWSGAVAQWDGDSRADHYEVLLYKDSVEYKTETTTGLRLDLTEDVQSGGDFKFRVRAIAGETSLYVDSDISDASSVINR